MIKVTRWSRQFHRWLAYGLGVIVALWVVTGVVMLFPPAPSTLPAANTPIDLSAAVRSPGEAAQALPKDSPLRVRSLALRHLGGRLVYHFVLAQGEHVFVDAATAQRVELSDSLALALARSVMVDASVTRSVTRITQHDSRYRFGILPVVRIELGDAQRTLVHVAADGSVTSTSKRSRLRGTMAALHEFQIPGNLIPARPRKALLLGASALTIILIVTGYVLALPVRRRS